MRERSLSGNCFQISNSRMTAAYLGVLSSTARINAFLTSNNFKCVPGTLLTSSVGTRGGAVWSGGLVLVPVFARFFQEDKHKAPAHLPHFPLSLRFTNFTNDSVSNLPVMSKQCLSTGRLHVCYNRGEMQGA